MENDVDTEEGCDHISTWSGRNFHSYSITSMDILPAHRSEPDDVKRRHRRGIIKSLSFPENIDEATRLIRRLKVHSVDDLSALDMKLAYLQNLIDKKRKTIRKIKDTPPVAEGEPIPDKYVARGMGRIRHSKSRIGYNQLSSYEIELVNAQEWIELDKSLGGEV